ANARAMARPMPRPAPVISATRRCSLAMCLSPLDRMGLTDGYTIRGTDQPGGCGPMNDGDALFQAILDDPDDTALRLVYADWLEEHGDVDRAEFIRVQCQLARMDREDDGWSELYRREQALLQRHEAEWLGRLTDYTEDFDFRFERGFVG